MGAKIQPLSCGSFSCTFKLREIAAETLVPVQLVFNLHTDLSWADYEEISLEYWPNQDLDRVASNPRISKLTVKMLQFETEAVEISDSVPEAESRNATALVIFFLILLILGICLLSHKQIKAKFRQLVRADVSQNLEDEFAKKDEDSSGSNSLFKAEDLEESPSAAAAEKLL